jgi:hypothetical protein
MTKRQDRRPPVRDALAKARKLALSYRVKDGRAFRLRDVDPGDTGTIASRLQAEDWTFPKVDRAKRKELAAAHAALGGTTGTKDDLHTTIDR